MKVIETEDTIELIPESEFEKEKLKRIANKTVKTEWSDSWDSKGNLIIRLPCEDWGT